MPIKTKTITLATWEMIDNSVPPPGMKRVWKVLQVTDSIEYAPDDMLDKATVDALCNTDRWKVTIKKI